MASNWAAVLKQPAAAAAPAATVASMKDKRVAVVDANAIIHMGESVALLAECLITTEEVLAEIRDSKSRQVIEQVSFVCQAPTEAAVQAISAFAKKTGDLHQLSLEDLRLLALAYTLEEEFHGVQHLRTEPVPVRTHAKQTTGGRLPGWGNNGASDEWDAIDEVSDESEDEDEEDSEEEAAEDEAAGLAGPSGVASGAPSAIGPATDAGGWETVRTSKNAARRAKRKAHRTEALATHGPDGERSDGSHAGGDEQGLLVGGGAALEGAWGEGGGAGGEGAGDAAEEGAPERDVGGDDHSVTDSYATTAPALDSNVFLVTGDFAMQNVALQMGLRLETRDGQRVTRLQRYILRCEGCRTVCKATGKLFCPECGHATLVRVSVTIDADGAEQYGVRKKHVLKGTRYALPKPRGGRNAPNPILSEDVFNARVRKPRKKPTDAVPDPFADGVSFGELKKHANQPSHIAQGLSHLATSWRNNPNERKNMTRTNRRR